MACILRSCNLRKQGRTSEIVLVNVESVSSIRDLRFCDSEEIVYKKVATEMSGKLLPPQKSKGFESGGRNREEVQLVLVGELRLETIEDF